MVKEFSVRNVFFVAILSTVAASAYATESGFYNFAFEPDSASVKPYTVCFDVINQGAGQQFLEQGFVEGFQVGPYGPPSGEYNIVAPKSLAIFMSTFNRNATPEYHYFLTGLLDKDNFMDTHHARYTIDLAAEPPPPERGKAAAGPRPGGSTIVETGAFSISFIGTNGCS